MHHDDGCFSSAHLLTIQKHSEDNYLEVHCQPWSAEYEEQLLTEPAVSNHFTKPLTNSLHLTSHILADILYIPNF